MGDGLAKVIRVLRHKGDDITFLQSVGINLFDKDQITGVKVRS